MLAVNRRTAIAASLSWLLVHLAGCAAPVNPAFPVTVDQAHRAIDKMRADRWPLPRPLVVIGGFLDPNVSPPLFAHFFDGVSRDATIIPVSVGTCGSFDECRQTVIAAVDRACPSSDPVWTTQVDVVGASLGGLVARYAAAPLLTRAPSPFSTPAPGGQGGKNNVARRLNIGRLFTISSPLAGARLANVVGFADFHRDMQDDSEFLQYLSGEDRHARYQLICYVHLDDEIVGDHRAAPPGSNPYWLANDSILAPHFAAMIDERILADIALRLRGEPAFSHPPPTPVP